MACIRGVVIFLLALVLGIFAAVPKIEENYFSGASQITPVKGVATFFNSSTLGFWTGSAHGSVNFFQADFPNQQPTIVDVHLAFPPQNYTRLYEIEILFNGNSGLRYCVDGIRMHQLHNFKVLAHDDFYYTSLKRYDISVTNEEESVIGRILRIRCSNCKRRSEILAGCAVIGRAQDEVYVDPANANQRIQ